MARKRSGDGVRQTTDRDVVTPPSYGSGVGIVDVQGRDKDRRNWGDPYPSPPVRPPVAVVRVRLENDQQFARTWGTKWAAAYYARRWLQTFPDDLEEIDDHNIVGSMFNMHLDGLTVDEVKKLDFPDWFTVSENGADWNRADGLVTGEDVPEESKTKRQREREGKKEKPARIEGAITLATLCNDIGVLPKVARRLLRAAKTPNPGRWEWKPDDPALKQVRELLKKAK